MIANYDLSRRLPTYDFFTWLVHVKLLGATHIVIRDTRDRYFMRHKWPASETATRLENYILPGPALARLPCGVGDHGDAEIGSHLLPDLHRDLVRLGAELPRLRSVREPWRRGHVTVTIRQSSWKFERNSDGPLWREFAERIGALVIEDYATRSLSLHDRVELYAGARANYGVPNGPLSMLMLTPYPMTQVCDPAIYGEVYQKQGVTPETPVPWLLTSQRVVWERPTMDVLMREHERCLVTS